jgi:hypothetical protein
MLRSNRDLDDFSIHATDGNLGRLSDFYFDDTSWVIRYLVVETGSWLEDRSVLISPLSLGTPNWTDNVLPVALTMAQVKGSPHIDVHRPVSRQHEIQWLGYYGYPYYWEGAGLWGGGLYPYLVQPDLLGFSPGDEADLPATERAYARAAAARHAQDDIHLRSCKAVTGYHVHATDGDIGHVNGMLLDEDTWAIRYLIVSTSNWWLGHEVLVAPTWIGDVSWDQSKVHVSLTREQVRNAPLYDPSVPINRDEEIGIFEHYARVDYWSREPTHGPPAHEGKAA